MFKDEYRTSSEADIWSKYCGFLNLSIPEFMEIQSNLLMEEIDLMAETAIGKKFMADSVPTNVEEFRASIPLTVYEDYAPFLNEREPDTLSEEPVCWAHTSGRSGSFKWIPYTKRAYEVLGDSEVTALLLAAARRKGEVRAKPGDRGVYNTPPSPYFSGIALSAAIERMGIRLIPPLELSDKMEFEERIEEGFRMAMLTGIEFLGSMTSVLVRVGESFAERSGAISFSMSMLRPNVLWRIARAVIRSRLEKRAILPRDLWPVKAILCSGTDTAIYRDQIMHYWGELPYELYACTEGGLIAFQNWNKKAMTFIPYGVFLEFIPEEEWQRNKADPDYQPNTVLLDEVEAGQCYEIVFTSFYGMPFLRYRVGDLIRIVSLRDDSVNVNLPQMLFESRADDIIDLAGFARLDERTIWKAIVDTGLEFVDWTALKEYEGGKPYLHLYLELKNSYDSEKARSLFGASLAAMDSDYADVGKMLEIDPLRLTLLPEGSFQRFLQEKKEAGFDLAHLKPPHMNASEDVLESLLNQDSREGSDPGR